MLFVVFVLIYSYFLCRKFGKLLLNDKEGILMRRFAKKMLRCMLYHLTSNLFVKVTAGKIVKGYIDHYVTSSLRYGSFNQASAM